MQQIWCEARCRVESTRNAALESIWPTHNPLYDEHPAFDANIYGPLRVRFGNTTQNRPEGQQILGLHANGAGRGDLFIRQHGQDLLIVRVNGAREPTIRYRGLIGRDFDKRLPAEFRRDCHQHNVATGMEFSPVRQMQEHFFGPEHSAGAGCNSSIATAV